MENLDKEELIEAVLQYGLEELEYASKDLLGDREFISELIRNYEGDYQDVLEYASEEIQSDQKFISELANVRDNLDTLEESDFEQQEVMGVEGEAYEEDYSYYEEIERDALDLELYDFASQGDWQKAMTIVKRLNIILEDEKTILELAKHGVGVQILDYIDENLKKDRFFMIQLSKYGIKDLDSDEKLLLLEDEDDIITLLNKKGEDVLEFIDPDQKGSIDFWVSIVGKDPELVRYALKCEEVINDLDGWKVVFQALRKDDSRYGMGIMDIPEVRKLEKDGDDTFYYALGMLENEQTYNERVHGFASQGLDREGYDPFTATVSDKEDMLKMILFDSEEEEIEYDMSFASAELLGDKDFLLRAIHINPRSLEYADVELKKNKEFILQAVKIDANALAYVSPELQGDSDVLLVTTGHPDFDSESWFYSEELQKKLSKFLESRESMQHTASEIAEGIEPTQTDIDSVQNEMISEQELGVKKEAESR